jgi:hypothetical protein
MHIWVIKEKKRNYPSKMKEKWGIYQINKIEGICLLCIHLLEMLKEVLQRGGK